MAEYEEVLAFWLEECSARDWYNGSEALDAKIRDRFEALWHRAMSGALDHWVTTPRGALAFLILTDQFPRNMFRGSAQAFASDPLARAVAKRAIEQNFDLRIAAPERQFFYLPLEHSECLSHQERAVRLVATRMPDTGDGLLLHARVHREIIRMFGRFPFRNAALGRIPSPSEKAFLDAGGYGGLLQSFQRQAA